ncbi:MAG: N-acetylmuramoyl-L-alanine amidase, partial [Ignavibacteria bacterium]|nr:N-acetylmuramoyl-L-alanine amidase [Ignavibacteria bacterium]
RKTDEFIELYERADIANRNNADLFISIHCNANKNTSAFGTESWTMGLHKTEGNLDVAKRENSSILLESDYQTKYDGFDPNSPEAYIMLSLNQNAFMNQSITLASKVEDAFIADGRQSRGVKQAGFLVLWRTTMPSTLIETGFLTNKNEEKYMISASGQNEIATSIFESVDAYRTKMEKEVNGLFNAENRTIINVDTVKKDSAKPIPEIKNETIKPVIEKKEIVKDEIIYKIQICASEKSINLKSTTYAQFKDAVNDVSEKGINRIVIGNYKSMEDSKARLALVKKQGFKDAFVVGYKNGVRFTIH